jgi:hypothetical protein
MDKLLEDLIREKAKAMDMEDYKNYAKAFVQEIKDPEKAFLAGGIDAMSYDVAALKNPRRLPSHEERKKLIKEILKI